MTQTALFQEPLEMGLTGTRDGMTPPQQEIVASLLDKLQPAIGRHGDCIGADAQFHALCLDRTLRIVIHPPTNPKYRAWCEGENVELLPERPYIVRDHAMVDAVGVLVATPRTPDEFLRSGTWATVRYARKVHRELYLISPDGSVRHEVWG